MLERQLLRIQKLKILSLLKLSNFNSQPNINNLINTPTQIILNLAENLFFDDAIDLCDYEFLPFTEILTVLSNKYSFIRLGYSKGVSLTSAVSNNKIEILDSQNLIDILVKNNTKLVNLLEKNDEFYYNVKDLGLENLDPENPKSRNSDKNSSREDNELDKTSDLDQSTAESLDEDDAENLLKFKKSDPSKTRPKNLNAVIFGYYLKLAALHVYSIEANKRNNPGQARFLLETLLKNLIKNGIDTLPNWLLEKFTYSSSIRVLLRNSRLKQALILSIDLFEKNSQILSETVSTENMHSKLEIIPWQILSELNAHASKNVSLSNDVEFLENSMASYLNKLEQIEQIMQGRSQLNQSQDTNLISYNLEGSRPKTNNFGILSNTNSLFTSSNKFMGDSPAQNVEHNMDDSQGDISLEAPFALR